MNYDKDQEVFCLECELWNKRNPDKMVNAIHHPFDRCGFLPKSAKNKVSFSEEMFNLIEEIKAGARKT